MKKVLFVCTGNTCRSPMCEGLMRDYAQKNGAEIECTSAGTCARGGEAVSENAVLALKEKGVDISAHRAKALTHELAKSADLIVAVGKTNFLLLQNAGYSPLLLDLPDPYGGDLQTYRECRDAITDFLPKVAEQL